MAGFPLTLVEARFLPEDAGAALRKFCGEAEEGRKEGAVLSNRELQCMADCNSYVFSVQKRHYQ